MSRARRRNPERKAVTRGAPAAPAAPARRGGAQGRLLAIAALVALATAVGVWVVTRRPSAPADPVIDPLATMSPRAAYDSALALANAGRHHESLPWFQRALRSERRPIGELHLNYAAALYNSTIEIQTRRGARVAAVRSSDARIALLRASLDEYQKVADFAPPEAQPHVRSHVGDLLVIYGLPWEAFVSYRSAESAAPPGSEFADRANQYQLRLQQPTRSP